jgi:DNA-binding CsgD family transcriptional regulator
MPGEEGPLRGRAVECEVLGVRVLAAARDGRGSVTVVRGAAGSGKSRLLHEARLLAQGHGLRLLSLAGDPDARVIPHGPLLDAVQVGPDPLMTASELAHLPRGPEQGYWLRRELRTALEKASMSAPVLICVDDLQWCDPETLRVLRTVPADLATEAVVWLLAMRREPTEPAVRATIGALVEAGADIVDLRPLDDTAVAEIAADVLGGQPDVEVMASVRRAGGVPLLLVEMLRGMRDEGLVRIDAGSASLVADGLPARLRDAVTRRTERLSSTARDLVQIGAVLGRRFPPDLLAAMLDRPPPALLGPVQEVIAAGLLHDDGEQLAFGHDLIREAVVAGMPASFTRALRRHAVDVLLARGATSVQVAALLAESAAPGDLEAVAALRRAAATLAPASSSSAAGFSLRALELLPDDAPERATVAAETVTLLWQSGRASDAQQLASTALAGTLGVDAVAEARIRLGLAVFMTLYSPIEAARQSETALSLPGLPDELRTRLVLVLGGNLALLGEADAAEEVLEPLTNRLRAAPDDQLAAAVARTRAHVAFHRGRWDEAFQLYRHATEAVDGGGPQAPAGDWERTRFPGADALFIGAMQVAVGHPERALTTLAPALAGARRHGRHGPEIWLTGVRLRALLDAGRLEEARAEAEAVLDMEDIDVVGGSTDVMVVYTLVRVALRTGADHVLREHRPRLERMTRDPAGQVRRNGRWLSALIADAAGDPATAIELTEEAVATLDRPGPSFSGVVDVMDEVVFVRIALRAGRRALAVRAAAAAERRAVANPAYPVAVAAQLLARGLLDSDPSGIRDALQILDGTERPLARADALEDLAVLLAPEHKREAVAALDEALETMQALGAERDAARLRRRLRDLGIRRRRPRADADRAGMAALTRAEREVALLVAAGGTNRAVADRLFLSPHTVNTHLRNAFVKLGVRSRVELARLVAADPEGIPAGRPDPAVVQPSR